MKKVLFIIKIIFRNIIISKQKKIDFFYLFGGIILSVFLLTTTMALFQGYVKTLKKNMLESISHIYIFKDGIRELDNNDLIKIKTLTENDYRIKAIQPIIVGQVIATNSQRIKSGIIQGINITKNSTNSGTTKLISGNSNFKNKNDIIIGSRLAEIIAVKVGDTIKLTSPGKTEITIFGISQKKFKCKVIGISESGMYEYDSSHIFGSYKLAENFATIPGFYTEIEIKLKNDFIDSADQLAIELQKKLGNYYQVHSWKYFNDNLFLSLQLQKFTLFVILSLLIIIATFNVISFVYATINKHKNQIGILLSFGTSIKKIKLFFLFQILITAKIAVIFAIIGGYLFALIIAKQTIYRLNAEIYMINNFKPYLPFTTIMIIYIVAISIIALATLFPLKKISNIKIIDIIRK